MVTFGKIVPVQDGFWRRSQRVGLSGLAIAFLGLPGCAILERGRQEAEQPAMADEIVAVDAVKAQTGSVEDELTYTGTTQPEQQVSLRSRVNGQVILMAVDVGDRIGTGETLAQLDTDLLTVEVNQAVAELQARQSEVAQAQASVSDAQTVLESARVRLLQAQTEADRLARLAGEGAVAIQDAEQAQLTVDTAQQVLESAAEQIRTRQAAVAAAQGRVAAQQAVVDQTEERLSFAAVRSPLNGVVLNRLAETGDYLETGDELLQVGDLSSIKIRIEVSDRELSKVSLGQPVTVRLDAFPDQTLSGTVTRIAPVADTASRLVPVEITIPNESGRIGSGLLARVTLQPEGSDRVTLPTAALEIAENSDNTVFVVQSSDGKEGTVEARTVTLGREAEGQVEVLSGLQAGETFVVRSGDALQDGQAVRLSILSETDSETNP